MAKKQSKAVAKKQAAGALEVPSFMQGMAGKGAEEIGTEAIEIPRITLVQDMTDSDIKGDVEPGSFMHSITSEDLGKEIDLVVCHAGTQYMLWQPRHMGGNVVLARALDGIHWDKQGSFEVQPFKGSKKTVTWTTTDTVKSSGLDQWGSTDPDEQDSPPAATLMYVFLCMAPQRPDLGPMVVSLQRSQCKTGKRFAGRLKLHASLPAFGQVFKMSVMDDTGGANNDEYFGYKFVANGLVTDEEAFNGYKAIYEAVRKTGGTTFAAENDAPDARSGEDAEDDGGPGI